MCSLELEKLMWMTQYQVISKTCVLFIDPVIPLNSVEHLLQKPLDQRRTFLRDINICFECSRKNNKQYKCHLIWNVWSEEVHIIQHLGFEKKVSVDEMCRFLSFLEAWRRRGYKIKRMRKKELKITQVCGDSLNFKENQKIRNKCRYMQWLMINQTKFQQVSDLFDLIGINIMRTNYGLPSHCKKTIIRCHNYHPIM